MRILVVAAWTTRLPLVAAGAAAMAAAGHDVTVLCPRHDHLDWDRRVRVVMFRNATPLPRVARFPVVQAAALLAVRRALPVSGAALDRLVVGDVWSLPLAWAIARRSAATVVLDPVVCTDGTAAAPAGARPPAR